jgi:hypothetical protein
MAVSDPNTEFDPFCTLEYVTLVPALAPPAPTVTTYDVLLKIFDNVPESNPPPPPPPPISLPPAPPPATIKYSTETGGFELK